MDAKAITVTLSFEQIDVSDIGVMGAVFCDGKLLSIIAATYEDIERLEDGCNSRDD